MKLWREALRVYFGVLFKHWKRGNFLWYQVVWTQNALLPKVKISFHWPQPIIAWRCAFAARWICLGCPIGKEPHYLKRAFK